MAHYVPPCTHCPAQYWVHCVGDMTEHFAVLPMVYLQTFHAQGATTQRTGRAARRQSSRQWTNWLKW